MLNGLNEAGILHIVSWFQSVNDKFAESLGSSAFGLNICREKYT